MIIYGTTTGRKMSEMYQSAFKLPSIGTRGMRVLLSMTVQTITLDSRFLYRHPNSSKRRAFSLMPPDMYAANRNGTDPKRQYYAILVSSFVVWYTRVSVSLYSALSREAEVMVEELTVYTAVNVDAPFERKLGVFQTCPFLE